MASILSEIEDTIHTGSIYNLKQMIFDKLLEDSIYSRELKYALTLRKTRPIPYGNISSGYTNTIYSNIRGLALVINVRNLFDDFGFDANDIELFCNSDYVYKVNELSSFNVEYSLSFNQSYDLALNLLKNNREIDQALLREYGFIPYDIFGNSPKVGREMLYGKFPFTDASKRSIRKLILDIQVVFSDLFWNELKEYVVKRFNKGLESDSI